MFRFKPASDLLGVSDDTVRRWGESGKLRIRKTESGRQVVDGVDLVPVMRDAAADSPLGSAFPHARASARNRPRFPRRGRERPGLLAAGPAPAPRPRAGAGSR
jgi:hypothetical protein